MLAGFLSEFAGRYPNVQVKLVEVLGWPETVAMLERGEIHLGQNLMRAVQPGDPRFGTHPLEPVDLLAAAHPRVLIGERETMEIDRLAPYPLLLLDGASCSAATSMPPAVLPALLRTSGLKAADPTLCWRWPSADMASPSSHQPYGRIGTRCGSSA